jgi:hypothetical protein
LAGRPFRNQGGWVFIGYNGLLAASDALGLGAIGAVLFQAVAAACATLALYDLGRQIGGRLAGVLGAAFFVVNYDIARWHQYVLTDSLYISMVVVTTWAVHRASERGGVSYLGAGVLIAITALVRPNRWRRSIGSRGRRCVPRSRSGPLRASPCCR